MILLSYFSILLLQSLLILNYSICYDLSLILLEYFLMHLIDGLDAFLLEGLYNFSGISVFVLEYGVFGGILSQELGNLGFAEFKQSIYFRLQLQVIEITSAVSLSCSIHRNVEMHGINDRSIEKIRLTHQHITKISDEVLLVMMVLYHQKSNLNVQVIFVCSRLHFEIFGMLVSCWGIYFWEFCCSFYEDWLLHFGRLTTFLLIHRFLIIKEACKQFSIIIWLSNC